MSNDTNNRNLSIFNFGSNTIRVIADNPQQPYFVAKDVCEVLEISNPRQAVKNIESRLKEVGLDGVISNDTILKDRLGRKQTLITINEQGLYELIFASRKKQAVKFRAWVTGQILPQLRQTGTYTLPTPPAIRRINAEGRSRVRDMVRKLVDNYADHYFDQNPQDRSESCLYQRRRAYLLTYGFIKTYFDLDKGGYKNLTADELNSLETVLDDKQDEFLGSDVFMLTRISPNKVMTKAQHINTLEPSNKALSQATDFVEDKPSELDFYHYIEKDKAINASLYSIKVLLDQSEGVRFDNQPGFALKLETLEYAYQTTNTLAHQIYDKSKQLETLVKDITDKEQEAPHV